MMLRRCYGVSSPPPTPGISFPSRSSFWLVLSQPTTRTAATVPMQEKSNKHRQTQHGKKQDVTRLRECPSEADACAHARADRCCLLDSLCTGSRLVCAARSSPPPHPWRAAAECCQSSLHPAVSTTRLLLPRRLTTVASVPHPFPASACYPQPPRPPLHPIHVLSSIGSCWPTHPSHALLPPCPLHSATNATRAVAPHTTTRAPPHLSPPPPPTPSRARPSPSQSYSHHLSITHRPSAPAIFSLLRLVCLLTSPPLCRIQRLRPTHA